MTIFLIQSGFYEFKKFKENYNMPRTQGDACISFQWYLIIILAKYDVAENKFPLRFLNSNTELI